ncbi:MAG: cobalamin-binding protein [Verrucomicrobia bacterium]|nr:cobalamin-binding protein [Verrucomicrobiota bacterium]NBU08244.1 cobalamin-binding protein [Pseudomonadota bacterium]NDA68241.1 cobalamin-binding protein [Verrucomicrobiota bacterium]NDB77022.1 cobalamin-binding protein [Verrucomicrobiota bacterium]NDD40007.1 cobalamin-binding protein [Verrucomicrobiota bacterium]
MSHRRIISLLPSATEIVCLLGCGDRLVGRSHECDFPIEVTSLPVCTESKLLPNATSREIDTQIGNLRNASLSVYRLNTQLMQELKPDLIITQSQCDVCAASEAEVARALGNWSGPTPQILSLTPRRLADVWEDIRRVAALLEVAEPGREALRVLKNRCVDVIEKACLLTRPSMACLEWLDPLMGAGNWVPELVELAGGKNVFGTAGQHTGRLRWEELRTANPDFIVALPCGFDRRRTATELLALSQRAGWSELKAVRSGRVFACDGSAYFNRPGPRLVDSLEILAEILHPTKFKFGHGVTGWAKFTG